MDFFTCGANRKPVQQETESALRNEQLNKEQRGHFNSSYTDKCSLLNCIFDMSNKDGA